MKLYQFLWNIPDEAIYTVSIGESIISIDSDLNIIVNVDNTVFTYKKEEAEVFNIYARNQDEANKELSEIMLGKIKDMKNKGLLLSVIIISNSLLLCCLEGGYKQYIPLPTCGQYSQIDDQYDQMDIPFLGLINDKRIYALFTEKEYNNLHFIDRMNSYGQYILTGYGDYFEYKVKRNGIENYSDIAERWKETSGSPDKIYLHFLKKRVDMIKSQYEEVKKRYDSVMDVYDDLDDDEKLLIELEN